MPVISEVTTSSSGTVYHFFDSSVGGGGGLIVSSLPPAPGFEVGANVDPGTIPGQASAASPRPAAPPPAPPPKASPAAKGGGSAPPTLPATDLASAAVEVANALADLRNWQDYQAQTAAAYLRSSTGADDAGALADLRDARSWTAEAQARYTAAVAALMGYAAEHPEILTYVPGVGDQVRDAFLAGISAQGLGIAGTGGLLPNGLHGAPPNPRAQFFFVGPDGNIQVAVGIGGGIQTNADGSIQVGIGQNSYAPATNTFNIDGGRLSPLSGGTAAYGSADAASASFVGPGHATRGFGDFVDQVPGYAYSPPGTPGYQAQGVAFQATLAQIRSVLATARIVSSTGPQPATLRGSTS